MRQFFLGLIVFVLSINSLVAESTCHSVEPTELVSISGSIDNRSTPLANGVADIPAVGMSSAATFADLNAIGEHSMAITIFDSIGTPHELTAYFFHTGVNQFTVRVYANSEEVDPAGSFQGFPRLVNDGSDLTLNFSAGTGEIISGTSTTSVAATFDWQNGASQSHSVVFDASAIDFHASASSTAYTADGRAVQRDDNSGSITSNILPGSEIILSGTLDSTSSTLVNGVADIPAPSSIGANSPTSFADLDSASLYSYTVTLKNPNEISRDMVIKFYRTGVNQVTARAYAYSQYIDSYGSDTNLPRVLAPAGATLNFDGNGSVIEDTSTYSFEMVVPWNDAETATYYLRFEPITFFAGLNEVCSISEDQCPDDESKIERGVCGCGTSEVDSDGDGTKDCEDECSADSNKILAGSCGCGIADTDSDQDSSPDCIDECDNDSNKVSAGICGCGELDTDTDSDGIADCNDECPQDANKILSGVCGCGVADTDLNEDAVVDCLATPTPSPTPSATIPPPPQNQEEVKEQIEIVIDDLLGNADGIGAEAGKNVKIIVKQFKATKKLLPAKVRRRVTQAMNFAKRLARSAKKAEKSGKARHSRRVSKWGKRLKNILTKVNNRL